MLEARIEVDKADMEITLKSHNSVVENLRDQLSQRDTELKTTTEELAATREELRSAEEKSSRGCYRCEQSTRILGQDVTGEKDSYGTT
jgi:flagellar motility protein MotE (MotC chaperone)